MSEHHPVLSATQFGELKHRIDNTDLVGLLVAQHHIGKLCLYVRSRISAGDKGKSSSQPDLPLKPVVTTSAVTRIARANAKSKK